MDRILELRGELLVALLQTFATVGAAIPLAVLIGTPLGIRLFNHAPGGISPSPRTHVVVSAVVNAVRSFPFMILLIAIIGSITITTVSFISYSAMVGLVVGGGIGDFAIRYGDYRYETPVMMVAIVLVLLVTFVQWGGIRLARLTDKRV